MKYTFKYGTDKISLEVKDGTYLGTLEPKKTKFTDNEKTIIQNAFNNPLKSKRIDKFINFDDRVLIVIPDKTRLSRLNIILPILLEKMKKTGVRKENIKFIFANGSHSGQSEDEKKKILGEKIYKSYSIYEHDAFDEMDHLYFGKTDKGTKIYLNKIIGGCDKIITIGAVSHHYFAGFGGGAKMLFPGLAYYKTIEQNHKRSISSAGTFNKNCKSGVLKNNPVYEDLKQVVDLCPPVFSICIMLDEKGKIIAAKSGNIISAHKAVSELVNKKYRIKIKAKSDLVICSAGGYPKDINLIQTNKTIYNSYQAVKPGGVIICLAECPEGIGSKTFLNWFGYDKAALKKNLLKNYSLNAQTALSVIEKSKSVRIILVSKLDPELVKKMGMTPAKNIESAFNEAKNYLKKYSYYVIKNCSSVVPYL